MSGVSTPAEAVGVSQSDPIRQSAQNEIVAPQTGLRNRAKPRPDGVPHLSESRLYSIPHLLTKSYLDSSSNDGRKSSFSTMPYMRDIACALVRLDAWALNTIGHACTTDPQIVGRYIYNNFKGLVSENTRSLSDYDDIYENRFENDIQESLEKLSNKEILDILRDISTSNYYAQFVQLRTLLYTTCIAENTYALKNAPNLVIPANLTWIHTPQQYVKHLTMEVSESKLKLRSVILGCDSLRDRIKVAAEIHAILPEILPILKKKMEALQLNFREACIEAEMDMHVLIDSSIEEWW